MDVYSQVTVLEGSHLNIERELLKRVSAGDPAAFARLMDAYYLPGYQTALKVLRNPELAKDIVQETFLKVWLRRKTLDTVENFGGWLRKVTVNLVYDQVTRARRETNQLSHWAREFNLSPAQEPPASEEIAFEALIDEALILLPSKQREAFVLIKKEGRSREEAAHIQGVSAETIKTNLERAMRSIRAYCLGKLDETSLIVIFSIILENSL